MRIKKSRDLADAPEASEHNHVDEPAKSLFKPCTKLPDKALHAQVLWFVLPQLITPTATNRFKDIKDLSTGRETGPGIMGHDRLASASRIPWRDPSSILRQVWTLRPISKTEIN